jgi:hypothetical protein
VLSLTPLLRPAAVGLHVLALFASSIVAGGLYR